MPNSLGRIQSHTHGENVCILAFGKFPPPSEIVAPVPAVFPATWSQILDRIRDLMDVAEEVRVITRYHPNPDTGSLVGGTVEHIKPKPKKKKVQRKKAARKK